MSAEYKFECDSCGFFIKDDRGYLSAVRHGMWGYFRCTKCHHFFSIGMNHDKYPSDPKMNLLFPFPSGGYSPNDETIDRFIIDVLTDGECPQCGEKDLEQWSLGTDGCPICGKKLKYDKYHVLYSD